MLNLADSRPQLIDQLMFPPHVRAGEGFPRAGGLFKVDLERGGADAHLGLKITQALTALESKDDYKKMYFNPDK